MAKTIDELRQTFAQSGRVEWIGLRPGHREPVNVVDEVDAVAGKGLSGDRAGSAKDSDRQVTLIQREHLPVIAKLCGRADADPALLRRNIVISGINLIALNKKRFRIGGAVLEGTDYCHPCTRMEENLGEGGYNAMRGHGGLTACVVEGGLIRVGDEVSFDDL